MFSLFDQIAFESNKFHSGEPIEIFSGIFWGKSFDFFVVVC